MQQEQHFNKEKQKKNSDQYVTVMQVCQISVYTMKCHTRIGKKTCSGEHQ